MRRSAPFVISSPAHPYGGCIAVLATLHNKERAIAPPLQRLLGLPVLTFDAFDTDTLGTFTGEIARKGSMRDVAGQKARLASGRTGRRIGLGSEGSFGPHPYIPFAAIDQETVALYDRELDVTIQESVVSLRTNYLHLDVDETAGIDAFLSRIGFADHAVVVGLADGSVPWVKGVKTRRELDAAISLLLERGQGRAIRVATDMRAHMNPTRMRVIRAAATRLAQRIKTLCPACGAPGFGIVNVKHGAPCSGCGEPTDRIATTIQRCARCHHTKEQPLQRAITGDPKYCPACNP